MYLFCRNKTTIQTIYLIEIYEIIRCFGGPLEDYKFLDYGNVVGMLGMLPRKQSDVVERLPHQIMIINYFKNIFFEKMIF